VSNAALRGAGTAEAWRRWDAPASWHRLERDLSGRAVVVSPHPDDETLATGHPALRSWRPLRIDLPDTAQRAKRLAMDCYTSQTTPFAGDAPVVPAAMLDRHRRSWETVLT